jgi:hypothetical protein
MDPGIAGHSQTHIPSSPGSSVTVNLMNASFSSGFAARQEGGTGTGSKVRSWSLSPGIRHTPAVASFFSLSTR